MPILTILRFVSPPLDTNAYIAADAESGHAVIIDPACIGEQLRRECESRGWAIDAIVATHCHIDHTHDMALLARGGTPVLCHAATATMLEDPKLSGALWLGMDHDPCKATRLLADGDTLEIGAAKLQVLHTPGHTIGCICLLGEEECFTGDLLFQDAVGRWDFPGGSQPQLIASLRRLAAACAGTVRLHPGHGEATTMGRERRHNPYLLEWLRPKQ